MAEPVEIGKDSGIFLGGYQHAINSAALRRLQITAAVNLSGVATGAEAFLARQLTVRVADSVTANVLQFFDLVADFVKEQRAAKRRVLVHCFAGRSRSVAVLAAYLCREDGLSLEDALDHIRKFRAVAKPNVGFCVQLNVYVSCKCDARRASDVLFHSKWTARSARMLAAERIDADVLAATEDAGASDGGAEGALVEHMVRPDDVPVTMQDMTSVIAAVTADVSAELDVQEETQQRIRGLVAHFRALRERTDGGVPDADRLRIAVSRLPGYDRAYACNACSRPLVYDARRVHHPAGATTAQSLFQAIKDGSPECERDGGRDGRDIAVYPARWMQATAREGDLVCPCSATVGRYSWVGIPCACGRLQQPAFLLDRDAVALTALDVAPDARVRLMAPSEMLGGVMAAAKAGKK